MDTTDEGGEAPCFEDRVCPECGRVDCEDHEAALLDKGRGPLPEP